jgi:hypothetical protein
MNNINLLTERFVAFPGTILFAQCSVLPLCGLSQTFSQFVAARLPSSMRSLSLPVGSGMMFQNLARNRRGAE